MKPGQFCAGICLSGFVQICSLFSLVSAILCTRCVCSAAGVNFSGGMLEAVTARSSRWCEVVQLQLHCCLFSHHCGANQCQGRGQLPAQCLKQLQAGTAVPLLTPPCSPSALFTFSGFIRGGIYSLAIQNLPANPSHNQGPPESLSIGEMKQ